MFLKVRGVRWAPSGGDAQLPQSSLYPVAPVPTPSLVCMSKNVELVREQCHSGPLPTGSGDKISL